MSRLGRQAASKCIKVGGEGKQVLHTRWIIACICRGDSVSLWEGSKGRTFVIGADRVGKGVAYQMAPLFC